jgi:hypothetical protein
MDPAATASGVRVMNVAVAPQTAAGELYKAVQARATELAPGFEPEAGLDLTFHGGKTIADLTYTNFYLGGRSEWSQSDVDDIDGALAAAMSDIGLNNMLAQYFDGRPPTTTFRPSQFRDGPLPGVIFKDQVEEIVLNAFGEGLFADFDLTSSVFNFLLPSGIVLSSRTSTGAEEAPSTEGRADEDDEGGELPGELEEEADSAHGLGGYHGGVHADGGTEIVYHSVGVFSERGPNGKNGIVAFDEPWKNVVATFYHELQEARSDPDVGDVKTTADEHLLGWYSMFPTYGGEIGDIPINEAAGLHKPIETVFKEVGLTDGSGTVPIQLMYSNVDHGPAEGSSTPMQPAAQG